jgi:hypothetical protein
LEDTLLNFSFKKVYFAYALLLIIVIMLLVAALAPASGHL